MSMSTVAQVRSSSKSTRSARTLLLVIASHVNPDTGWAWPSLATLARETAVTMQHVIRLIHHLEALGELEVRRGHGRGHVNFYRIREIPAEPNTSRPRKSNISEGRKSNISAGENLTARFISPGENLTARLPERKREREKKGAPLAPVALSLDKPERQNRFWCEACGYIIQACAHRVIEVDRSP
jgi:Helix-turn-helix domain